MSREVVSSRDKPNLFEYYDVFHKTPPDYDQTNEISRILSAVVDAINSALKMPKLIVIFFDVEIIRHIEGEMACK